MRFLGIGEDGDLGEMYYRLAKSGNDVRVYIQHEQSHDVFGGMIERIDDWRDHLEWVKEAGPEGVIVFESALRGATQDDLRRQGYQVIGGSSYGDQLESDREFGQKTLRELGLPTAHSHHFTNYEAAIAFVRAAPARYVLKHNGADSLRTRNYVGEMANGEDIVALLNLRRRQQESGDSDFVLMDYVDGVEVGVGAYFNGERFLLPACLDWEHKRFFPGDLGELTGEMGTIVTYRGAERIFEGTLALMAEKLRASAYCGYINLNLMANAQGLWPLEFTCRFGYPGYAICETLHLESWDKIFLRMLDRQSNDCATRSGYAAGIVLSVPPFPYSHGYAELSKGSPLCLRRPLTGDERTRLHMCEVETVSGQLVVSGTTGCVGVATGYGETIETARAEALKLAQCVVAPNLRYRKDIGQRLIDRDFATLRDFGYIDAGLRP